MNNAKCLDNIQSNIKISYKEGLPDLDISSLFHHHSPFVNFFRKLAFMLSYPLTASRSSRVQADEIALVKYNEECVFKGPGHHFVLKPKNKIEQIVSINTPLIVHGPHKIIRVPDNQLGFGYNVATDEILLLGRGVHYFNNQDISVIGPFLYRDKNFKYNIANTIHVVGVNKESAEIVSNMNIYLNESLFYGIYFFNKKDAKNYRDFQLHLSLKEEMLNFSKSKFFSQNKLELAIKFKIYYKIVNPLLAFNKLCAQNWKLKENLSIIMQSIFRKAVAQLNVSDTNYPSFQQKTLQKSLINEQDIKFELTKLALDLFESELHNNYGIQVINLELLSLEKASKPNPTRKNLPLPKKISPKQEIGINNRQNVNKSGPGLYFDMAKGGVGMGIGLGSRSGVQPVLNLNNGSLDMGFRL